MTGCVSPSRSSSVDLISDRHLPIVIGQLGQRLQDLAQLAHDLCFGCHVGDLERIEQGLAQELQIVTLSHNVPLPCGKPVDNLPKLSTDKPLKTCG
jgi:hypothetical protein